MPRAQDAEAERAGREGDHLDEDDASMETGQHGNPQPQPPLIKVCNTAREQYCRTFCYRPRSTERRVGSQSPRRR